MDVRALSLVLGAEIVGNMEGDGLEGFHVSVDSRSLQHGGHTIFFALRGLHHDGHDFVPGLLKQGVSLFVVSKLPSAIDSDVCFLVVSDTLRALQAFAAYRRSLFSFPLIAVTGSRGKTIVKEWLNFLLTPDFTIIKSPKSYNSQTGVALSLFGIQEKHNLGLFEAGISTVHEMCFLERMLKPTIGVLTSIGSDHDEGFGSEEEKISEKLQLFKDVAIVICPYDERCMRFLKQGQAVFSWSFEEDRADVFFTEIKRGSLGVKTSKGYFELHVPFDDIISLQNIGSCICVLLTMGYSEEVIRERINNLYEIELRLEVKRGQYDALLIDDSYSSDFQSLKIALDFLEKHQKGKGKTVVLSDVFQSGYSQSELYVKVSELLVANRVDRLIGIGPEIGMHMKAFKEGVFYPDTESFLRKMEPSDFQDGTVLIKGARRFQFDKIVSLLEEKTHETVLEINLNAIRHNLNYYRSKLEVSTKVMAMVKAFGYGNGSVEIAKLLAHEQVDYLGVAFADEGVLLRKAGVQIPIIVMNPEVSAFSVMLSYQLEPEIFSFHVLESFLKVAREHNEYLFPIHLKIDTGMHRLGFVSEDIDQLIEILKTSNAVEAHSVFSHLSSSDMEEHRAFTLHQIQLFREVSERLEQGLGSTLIKHILNTAGVFRFKEHQMDMVRLGIGLYGVGNYEDENAQLETVGTLKTVIMQIRDWEAGESVGYGRRYRTDRMERIATIPIGYADGIHRSWGNGLGFVMINGQKAPIVGSICMDMMMVNVSSIPCEVGDVVEIFGSQLPIQQIAASIHTIPYEIMTSVSQRVKRIFFES